MILEITAPSTMSISSAARLNQKMHCLATTLPLANKSIHSSYRGSSNEAASVGGLVVSDQTDVSPIGPSLPRRSPAFVSVIRCLAAALGPWPARQLMTHLGSGELHRSSRDNVYWAILATFTGLLLRPLLGTTASQVRSFSTLPKRPLNRDEGSFIATTSQPPQT